MHRSRISTISIINTDIEGITRKWRFENTLRYEIEPELTQLKPGGGRVHKSNYKQGASREG